MGYNKIVLLVYVAYLVIMSFAALVLFVKDKEIAKKGSANRIKEKTLLQVTVLGGAIGAFCGRLLAHHKTDKIYFSIVIYLSLILQVALLGLMLVIAL